MSKTRENYNMKKGKQQIKKKLTKMKKNKMEDSVLKMKNLSRKSD